MRDVFIWIKNCHFDVCSEISPCCVCVMEKRFSFGVCVFFFVSKMYGQLIEPAIDEHKQRNISKGQRK